MTARFADLRPHERKVYSQFGEDGVIEYLLSVLSPVTPFAVEIGVWVGPGFTPGAQECNTRALRERPGWRVLQIDGAADEDHPLVTREFVTAENVEGILRTHHVPGDLALLGLDVDGMDYWIWAALSPAYRPRVVVIEYNGMFSDLDVAKVVPYDPGFRWDGTSWTGASLGALVRLGRRKGYVLVHCTESNSFFVARECVGGDEVPSPQEIYSRRWGYSAAPVRDPRRRPWVDCGSEFDVKRKLRYLWRHYRERFQLIGRPPGGPIVAWPAERPKGGD